MIGAIIGDVVGSRFEFDNINTKEFEFWGDGCEFTDDTVMTIAVAESLLYTRNPEELGKVLKEIMRDYGHGYPNVGYGGMFRQWLMSADPQPYNSFGNGSAMRVSPCGYVAESLEEALALAKASAEISHNHPEGIKGAQAVAVAIYMAKLGIRKDGIKKYIEDNFYKLDFTLNSVKQDYHFSESCQDTVPQSIQCFLLADSFEDTIRNAISIGGDSDTIACIAGSIAEAYYGVPDEMTEKVKTYLPKCFIDVVDNFYSFVAENSATERIKDKINEWKEWLKRHNAQVLANGTGKYIHSDEVYVGRMVRADESMKHGCFKCECGWFTYSHYWERGITEGWIEGPWNEQGVLKYLRQELHVPREIACIEEFTNEEQKIRGPLCHLDDFPEEYCKNCKHVSWCVKRGCYW